MWKYADDPTHSKMSVLFVWPAALFSLAIWWTFFSGWSWRVRAVPWAAIFAAGIAFIQVYRIDGSDGDMVPRLSYTWEPTPEAKAVTYLRQQSALSTEPSETIREPAEVLVESATSDDSPDYRGPNRDGILRGVGFRKNWSEMPPQELWRHPVGLAWSSFSVLGDRAITMEQREDQESTVCYRLSTGELLWSHGDPVRFAAVAVNGGDGPHGTPVIDGESTYTLGGTGVLNCLETATGKRRWTRNILEDAGGKAGPVENIQWGMSATPLVVDDLVIAIPGGKLKRPLTAEEAVNRSVIAYDRMTGDIRWAHGEFPASYCGPRIEELAGVRQLLIFHGYGLSGLALDSGNVLWSFDWENMPKVNAAQPLKIDDSSLIIGSGYGIGATRLSISADGGKWTVTPQWKTNKLKLKFNDAILHDGYVYGLDDGILTCVDIATGKPKWKGGRYGYGQMLLHNQTLLILTEDGEVALVAASPTRFEEQSKFKAIDGTTWNHPVVARGKLLVRNQTEAACYDVAP